VVNPNSYLDPATEATLGSIAEAGFVVAVRRAGALIAVVATDAGGRRWTAAAPDPYLAACRLASLLGCELSA